MSARPPLADLARRALDGDPAQRAIEYEGRWRDWGEVRHVADGVEALIAASGAAPHSRIAFIPRNEPAAVAALMGLVAAARSIQMIYAFQAPAALVRDLERLQPAVVLAGERDLTDAVQDWARAQGAAVIALGQMEAHALSGLQSTSVAPLGEASDEPLVEILTSGTTGPPKRFPIRYSLIESLTSAGTLMQRHQEHASGADAPAPALLFMPLGNISGIYTTIPTMVARQPAVLMERFTLQAWRDFVVRYRPTASGLPPSSVQSVLDADIPPEDLASIRMLGVGAAPLDPTVHRAFLQRYGIPLLLSYGATEFGGPVTAMTPDLHARYGEAKFGSVGRPIGGARLRVVDAVTGAELPPGQEGLLEVVSPRIGTDWIHTSDVAVIDADGFLFLHGRADGAIMRGGFKLLPETIERALLLHPALSGAAVVAAPDRRVGQVPGAALVVKPGHPAPSAAEMEAHLRQHLPATHIPTHWRVVDDLPKTPSMKIDRPAVTRLFEQADATEAVVAR